MNYRTIVFSSDEYLLSLKLRNKILRKPLGLTLTEQDCMNDVNEVIFGGFYNDKLIATVQFVFLQNAVCKMRQMAVAENFQSKGIGKELILFAENYLFQHKIRQIELHARKTAVNFYRKLGYQTIGNIFTEVNIPHYKMYKKLMI